MGGIVVVGSLNMDLVAVAPRIPAPGETLLGSRHFTAFGGKGANQAYAAAKLGGEVIMLGRVGADRYGELMRANLASVGCDVADVRVVDGASGVALIVVSEAGENSIVVTPGVNQRLRARDVEAHASRLGSAGYVLLQLESPMEAVVAAARAAKRSGARVVLDPAPVVVPLPPELLALVDILTPNESEAAELAGLSSSAFSIAEGVSIGRGLCDAGAGAVALKLGARGCLVVTGADAIHIAPPTVEAVDTTAAGDVFNAAMAVALCEGEELPAACAFATRAAALSVTRMGAQASVPERREVDMLAPGVPDHVVVVGARPVFRNAGGPKA